MFRYQWLRRWVLTTDVDKQADFSAYRTFHFGAQAEAPTSIDGRRIEQGLAEQLEDSRQIDFYIHYFVAKCLAPT